jgi:endonuclease/exonuclease/phosphatase family metal-dependent hydrolase
VSLSHLRIASWNIGGGILGDSHQRGGLPDLTYHIDLLKQHAPDVVCLQEAHSYVNGAPGQAEHIAAAGGFQYVETFPMSESHLDDKAHLSLSVLSRLELQGTTYRAFENPGLSSIGPTGERWKLFDKGYMQTDLLHELGRIRIINAHCFPLHYFGASPTEPRFAHLWHDLCTALLSARMDAPTILAIDLNHEPVEELLGSVLGQDKYINAFAATPTIPGGSQQDYILYDANVRLLTTAVHSTEADHSYCEALVELPRGTG